MTEDERLEQAWTHVKEVETQLELLRGDLAACKLIAEHRAKDLMLALEIAGVDWNYLNDYRIQSEERNND